MKTLSFDEVSIISTDLEERWVDIEGYEGRYQVSDHGRVRTTCYRGKKNKIHILTPYFEFDKYLRVGLRDPVTQSYKGKLISALVAKYFLPRTDESKDRVHHKDFNLSNNDVHNLEWVNMHDVMKIAQERGTWSPKRCGDGAVKSLGISVKCLNDNKIFQSYNSASKYYNVCRRLIIQSITTGQPICTSKNADANGLRFSHV